MAEMTQKERDLLRLGWDRNGPLCRAMNDADRLARAEELIQSMRVFVQDDHNETGQWRSFLEEIDGFLSEKPGD